MTKCFPKMPWFSTLSYHRKNVMIMKAGTTWIHKKLINMTFCSFLCSSDATQCSQRMALSYVLLRYQRFLYKLKQILLKKAYDGTFLTWIIHLVMLKLPFCLSDREHWCKLLKEITSYFVEAFYGRFFSFFLPFLLHLKVASFQWSFRKLIWPCLQLTIWNATCDIFKYAMT